MRNTAFVSDLRFKPKCKTRGDQLCVFPFIYEGKTYKTCTKDGVRPEDDPWCPFKTNSNNEFSTNNWGYCSENCEKEEDVDGEIFETSTVQWWRIIKALPAYLVNWYFSRQDYII